MPRLIDVDNLTYHLAVNDEDQQFFLRQIRRYRRRAIHRPRPRCWRVLLLGVRKRRSIYVRRHAHR